MNFKIEIYLRPLAPGSYCTIMIPTVETFQFQKEISGSSSAPVLFTCLDSEEFQNYYVKYIHTKEEFDCLVYEVVCQQIARELAIKTPEIAFVDVLENSFHQNQLFRNNQYLLPGIRAFGSKELSGVNLLEKHHRVPDKHTFNLYAAPFDLIKITLFDLLVDNRDRSEENFNLLQTKTLPIDFYAFDHYFCFGGKQHIGAFHTELYVNIHNTLIGSDFCKQLFYFVPFEKLQEDFDNYIQRYYRDISYLITLIDNVFLTLPHQWNFSEDLKERIQAFISSPERVENVKHEVRTFLPYLKKA